MPSQADDSFLPQKCITWRLTQCCVSMPSQADDSFLHDTSSSNRSVNVSGVNALSGWWLISTLNKRAERNLCQKLCQCPLRLMTHFYNHRKRRKPIWLRRVNALSGWWLISTTKSGERRAMRKLGVNALSGWWLISTVPLQKPRFYAVSRACFCRYLSEYSDSSRFSCMLTFWTYLMRCTYPWHWIKYSTKYKRCHPIFSLSW